MRATSTRTAIGVLAATAAMSLTLATIGCAGAERGERFVSLVDSLLADSPRALAEVIHGTGGTNHSQLLLPG
jgi:hypothetical protein